MAYQDFAGKRRPSSSAYPEKSSGYVTVDDPITGTGKFPIDNLIESIAPVFDSTVNYTAGQPVMYRGTLYTFTVDHPAGEWNASHVYSTNMLTAPNVLTGTPVATFGTPLAYEVTSKIPQDTRIKYDASLINGRTLDITYNNNESSGTVYFHLYFYDKDGNSIRHDLWACTAGTPLSVSTVVPSGSTSFNAVSSAYTLADWSIFVSDNIEKRLEDTAYLADNNRYQLNLYVFGLTESYSINQSLSVQTNVDYDVSKLIGKTISVTYSNDNTSGTSYFKVKFSAADGTAIQTDTYAVTVGTPVTKNILIPNNSYKMTIINFEYTKCSYSFYIVDNISARLSESENTLVSVGKDIESIDSAVFGTMISDSVTTSKPTTTNVDYDVSRIGGRTLSITLSNNNTSGTAYQNIYLYSEDGTQLERWTEAVVAGTPLTIVRKVPASAVKMTVVSSAYVKASWSFRVIDNIDDRIENFGEYSHTLSVKKDGTGDFTTIQAAVASCSVPGKFNRYKIEVFDDFEITDITDLFTAENSHTSAPDRALSVFWPRDYVDVVGMNGRRKISVIMPSNLDPEYLKWIQPVYGQKTFKLENFELVVKNGRYALHQDEVHDVNAHTIYKNVRCVHLGNDDYQSGWKSELAAAFGTTSGMTIEFIDCEFVTTKAMPWYFHTQLNFSKPSRVIIDNCSFNGNSSDIRNIGISSQELGSGCSNFFEIRNCALPVVGTSNIYNLIAQLRTESNKNYWNQKMQVIGDKGLQKRILTAYTLPVAVLSSTDGISEVDVVGGSAADALWIEAHKKGAVSFGSSYIGSGAFSLASMLGDCSVDNKTLVVSVGGTDQTITLDSDYTSMSNSDAISDINSRLSGASFSITEKTYDLLNGDYFETIALSSVEFGEIILNGFESGVVSVKTSAGDIVRCAKCKSNYFLTADVGNVGTEVADGVVEFT